MMPKNKIMFVCTGNTCRSPMAEAVFNRFAEEKGLAVRAESMGTTTVTGMPVSENSIEVCKEIGIDISDMHSTAYSDKKSRLLMLPTRICAALRFTDSAEMKFAVPLRKF